MDILKVYKEALLDQKRYLWFRGGASSGKSYFAAEKVLIRTLTEDRHKFLVLRKIASTIRLSTWSLFKEIILDNNLSEYFTINKSEFTITCKLNNNTIHFAGLDDPEKIKSISGITGMLIEEVTEYTWEDIKQLKLRIRGKKPNYVQYISLFNPIDDGHWIKKEVWDKGEDNQNSFYVTTYKDNPTLSKEDIEVFESEMKLDENMYRIYALGEWGTSSTEGALVRNFLISNHTGTVQYNPELPLHITFDFNVLPFVSATVIQVTNDKVGVVECIGLEYPNNLTKDTCIYIRNKYREHQSGMFIYGDVAGKHRDTRGVVQANDYTIIKNELKKFVPQLRVGNKAPSILMSTNFLNYILQQGINGLDILIDDKSKGLINDFLYLKQNSDGGKLIEYTKHPSGAKYEKYGHYFDNFRYFIVEYFKREYNEFIRGGVSVKPKVGRTIKQRGY